MRHITVYPAHVGTLAESIANSEARRALAKEYKRQYDMDYPSPIPNATPYLLIIDTYAQNIKDECEADQELMLADYISKRLQDIHTPSDLSDEQAYSLREYAFDVINSRVQRVR